MVASKKKEKAVNGVLKGMDAIEQFSGFNRVMLLRWKNQLPLMPMNKAGGIYIADPEKLRKFLKDVAAGETEKWLDPEPDQEPEPDASDADDKDNKDGKDESGSQDKDQDQKGNQAAGK